MSNHRQDTRTQTGLMAPTCITYLTVVMSPVRLLTTTDYAGEGQQQLNSQSGVIYHSKALTMESGHLQLSKIKLQLC
jgi:hypothetical protein